MSDELERVGSTVWAALGRGVPRERRLAAEWPRVVGPEIAQNAQPRSLRGGRLVVATSSSVWAQTLQLMAEQVRRGLNEALGAPIVEDVVFRPAGWDPGGGRESPRPLGPSAGPEAPPRRPGEGDESPPPRPPGRGLSEAEEQAIAEVKALACDDVLGEQIARAMRAYLQRQPG